MNGIPGNALSVAILEYNFDIFLIQLKQIRLLKSLV